MMKFVTLAAVAAVTLAVTAAPQSAQAENGRNAAAIGGLAVGAIIGSQLAGQDDGYRRHHYRTRYRECRIERRDWEDRRGRIHVRRVRVCD